MSKTDHPGDPGTCGFCGYGNGFLGEQGDDTSQQLHAAVRSGETPNWTYESHPNAHDQMVTWCGNCVGGLLHKFQRYDDTNLHAYKVSLEVRFELDGLRWSGWDEHRVREQPIGHADDPGIHLDKLRDQRNLIDAQNELSRRAGFDLTTRGWRA